MSFKTALIFCLLGAGAEAGMVDTVTHEVVSNATGIVETALKDVALQPKPAQFNSFAERLDYIHENLYNDYNTRVHRADTFAATGLSLAEKPADSRFRIGLFAEVSQEDKTEYSFTPDFEAEIDLPNVEKRWKIIVNSTRPSELPDTDPTEKSSTIQLGMRTYLDLIKAKIDTGIRVKWLPEAYAQSEWSPAWSWGQWKIRPSQKVYYETDEGFGEQTALRFFRWFGKDRSLAAGSLTAGTFSESSDGLEWVQAVKAGYIGELLDESNRGREIGGSDLALGFGLAYYLNGSDTIITQHKVALLYRRPIYKKWIYLEIDPGIKWKNDSDWKTDPYILCGLDLFFWGSSER
ncbi:MAG: hypothetical protein V2A34_02900 [Lentisphaerota bacterium]